MRPTRSDLSFPVLSNTKASEMKGQHRFDGLPPIHQISPKVSSTNLPTVDPGIQMDESTHPDVIRYESLIELREQWKLLDQEENAFQLTVLLFLGKDFNGHLQSLIRRKHPALRLVIASESGYLPGLTTVGDLKLYSASLGWHLISFHRQPLSALDEALMPMTRNEHCVMFCPDFVNCSWIAQ